MDYGLWTVDYGLRNINLTMTRTDMSTEYRVRMYNKGATIINKTTTTIL